jgi:ATP-dependent exoDNAse (exonuclease V) beta subunit
MFLHIDQTPLPKLQRVTQPNGVRTYETPTGERYPSVTTVTGLLKKDVILEWRKRVGNEEANKISSAAARRGTRIHTLCEKYLSNEVVQPNLVDHHNWNELKEYLDRIDNIHVLEQPVFSHHLEVAGTVDCIAEYNGKLAVIDFKTSRRNKTRDDIHDYFMQCSAYAVAYEEMTGIPVPNILILISTDEHGVLVFPEKRNEWIADFIKLRAEYKTLYNI